MTSRARAHEPAGSTHEVPDDFILVMSRAARRRTRATVALASDPAVAGTVLFRPSEKGGSFAKESRLALASRQCDSGRATFDKTCDVRGILVLDRFKAFDRVKHRHILREISALNLGRNFNDFTTSFLANRKAHIRLGTVSGGPYELGNRGTPQGSVLSPLLFNIATHRLFARLAEIPNVGHAIYADDISIWVPGRSMATIEHSLQNVLETIEGFLSGTGLDLSQSKSELLLYRQSRHGVRNLEPLESLPIVTKAKNVQPMPRVDSVKILGLLIDAKGCNATALNKLSALENSTLATKEWWDEFLRSDKHHIQLQAAQRARDIATELRLPSTSVTDESSPAVDKNSIIAL
ncbi:uncharacterized protein LOC119462388 [Dermacentor silvarum]|uniref:uncharacterized protein LOC119462388 n=1 Tax=Dermacentor silvarum TaxID=543639 RepID=UPI001897679C|nr:uncharacterized protein LOC119462388 [Dermacentor silvarum]